MNGQPVGQVDVDVTVPVLFSAEGLSCGSDYGDSVDKDSYEPPIVFTGAIGEVAYDLTSSAIDDAEAAPRLAMAKQ